MAIADMCARTNISDEDAKRKLTRQISISSQVSGEALKRLSQYRHSFQFDRAYRLLEAYRLDLPVNPIETSHADQFRREAELGWMPLDEAFQCLATLVPALVNLQSTAKDTQSHALSAQLVTMRQVEKIVGPDAEHPDPIVRSPLSRSIAWTYLEQVGSGNQSVGMTPYFLRSHSRQTTISLSKRTIDPRAVELPHSTSLND